MDSSTVQLPMDPAAAPEAPRSKGLAPGRKRDDQAETSDAAAAALTVSFADILRSKKLAVKTGTEERDTKEPLLKARQAEQKEGEDAPGRMIGKLAAAGKQLKKTVVEVQAQETLEHAKELAGQAMKASSGKTSVRESADAALSKKGALTPTEEGLLREMVQKNGSIAGQKKAAQMTGYVNGEPLNRREGINAVKSMTAKEGEVLKILTGGEAAQAPSKAKAAKPSRPQQAFVVPDASAADAKALQAAPSAEAMKNELVNSGGTDQDKTAESGFLKKQTASRGIGTEGRDALAFQAERSASVQGKTAGALSAARPQAVMGQVLDGAAQLLRDGSGRMVLTLQPPRLGTLDLDVVVQDNRVKMVMLADNQEVKQLLQAGMDDLRNALQDKGFEIDRLEVLVQNRPDQDGAGFWQEAGFARGENERKTEQEKGPVDQGIPVRQSRAGDSGLSVFA